MKFIEQRSDGLLVVLSENELGIINNALNEVSNGIDLHEFETRLGCTLAEAKELLSDIGRVFQALKN